MGIRKDLGEPCFPEAQFGPGTDRPYRTCRDAISDLPTRNTELGLNEDVYSQDAVTEYQKMMRKKLHGSFKTMLLQNHKRFCKRKTIALVPEGGNYKDLPAGVWGE